MYVLLCIIFTLLLQNAHVLLTVLTENYRNAIDSEKYYAEMLFQEVVPTSKVGAKTYYFGHFHMKTA